MGYLKTFYNYSKRPPTEYPNRLVSYLVDSLGIQPCKMVDLGSGRGDYLRSFRDHKFDVVGVDLDPDAAIMSEGFEVKTCSVTDTPFADNSFDLVFNKSVIEHLKDPEKLLAESHRILKPGGYVITLCPSWVHMGWGPFYQDHTHVTPFILRSLVDIHSLVGFSTVRAEHFRQLPLLWKFPFLVVFCELVRFLPIPYRPQSYSGGFNNEALNKVVRFSNEVMLLVVAQK